MSKRAIPILSVVAVISVAIWYGLHAGHEQKITHPISGERIIAFGDSLIEGVGASSGNDMVLRLSRALGIPIINAGRGGDTTQSALQRLERDVLSQNPRIVLVLLGGNDALGRVAKEDVQRNLSVIIDRITGAGAAVLLLGVRSGFLQSQYNDTLAQLAREKPVTYIPDILAGVFGHADLMSDPIHPNDAGYTKMAERILPVIQKMLK